MNSIFTKILWTIWAVICLLLIASSISDLEITSGFVNKALICIFILGLTGLVTLKRNWTSMRTLAVSAVIFGMFLIINFYLDWRGDWKTQTILYINNHTTNRTIEFQLQDKGAFGYNRRTVDRVKIIPFVSWTKRVTEADLLNLDSLTWNQVNIDVNEQGLKGG
jgi:hypothetical protein